MATVTLTKRTAGRVQIFETADTHTLPLAGGGDPNMAFKIGQLVVNPEAPGVLYEIIAIRWGCPPQQGGIADLKFWGADPNIKPHVKNMLAQRDLENDVFGSYLKDLAYPENGMEVLAISAQ